MARNRTGLTFNSTYFDRSRGGSALRSGMPSLGKEIPDPSLSATALTGTGSSHAGRQLGGGTNGLTRQLTRHASGLLSDTPTSLFKDDTEKGQYYQDAIRRFEDAAAYGRQDISEAAISAGLRHSGAFVGARGDLAQKLQMEKNAAALGLAVEDRNFQENALINRTNAAAGIQGQVVGQGFTRAGLMGVDEYGRSTQQARQSYRDAYGEEPPPGWTPDAMPATTGPFAGAPGVKPLTTLAAQRTKADIMAQQAATDLAGRAQGFTERTSTAGLTGKMPLLTADGTPALDAKGQQMFGDTLDAQRLGLQTAETMGGYTDPVTGKWVSTLAGQSQKFNQAFMAAAAQGKVMVLDAKGNPQMNPDGTPKLVDSLEAQRLGLQTTETMGGYTDPVTKKWVNTLAGQAFYQKAYQDYLDAFGEEPPPGWTPQGMPSESVAAGGQREQGFPSNAPPPHAGLAPPKDPYGGSGQELNIDPFNGPPPHAGLAPPKDPYGGSGQELNIDPFNGPPQETAPYRPPETAPPPGRERPPPAGLAPPGRKTTLAGRAASQNELNAAMDRAIAQGNATGKFVDPVTKESYDTLVKKQQEFAQGLSSEQTYGGRSVKNPETGKFEWQDTAANAAVKKEQDQRDEQMYGGKITGVDRETGKPIIRYTVEGLNAMTDRALKAASATGKYVDPQTGASLETIQSRQLNLQITEAHGGVAPVTFTQNQLTSMGGARVGDPRYNPSLDVNANGIIEQDDIAAITDDAKDLGGGRFSYTPAGSRTLSGQQADTQAAFAGKTLDLEQEKVYGGKFVTEANGDKKWQGTIAYEQMTGDQKLAYAKLAEDTRQSKSAEKLALADRLGWTDAEPGKVSFGEWAQAFRDFQGKKAYDVTMDLNGDGRIDNTDLEYGQTNGLISEPGKTFSTLEAKKVKSQIDATADALKLDRDKLNEVIRQSNENFWTGQRDYMTKATGYVYDAYGNPKEKMAPDEKAVFGEKEIKDMFAVMGKHPGSGVTRADEGYNAAFDLNDDGHISDQEFWNTINDATALAQEWPEGVKRYSAKKTKTQVSTLEREQFRDGQDRFNQTFNNAMKEFAAQLGLDKAKLDALDEGQKLQLLATLGSAGLGALGAYLGRSRTSGSTAPPEGGSGGGGGGVGIGYGTGGFTINFGGR